METNGWGHLEGCPSNEKERDLIKELTISEEFYASKDLNEDLTMRYVDSLEKRIKAKNEAIKVLIDMYKTLEGKEYIINELTKIIKL